MNAAQMARITVCIWTPKISSTPQSAKEATHDKLQSGWRTTLVVAAMIREPLQHVSYFADQVAGTCCDAV